MASPSPSKQHLKHLLNQDQEPFVLQNYINEKRLQLKKKPSQLRRPISETSTFATNLCKNACFLSSPDVMKSPFFDFSTPAKSPCRNSNTLFVHIPSRTAALLLEAAFRIQNQSKTNKSCKASKNLGFGFLGSILKRITRRKKNQEKETKQDDDDDDEIRVSVKDILRWDSAETIKTENRKKKDNREITEKIVSDVGFSFSSWSETNEEKSLDSETTSTSRSEDYDETEFLSKQTKTFPSSRFVLKAEVQSPSSSPVLRSPGIESPPASPIRHKKQVVENEEQLNHVDKEEHNSPVSVLEPQFEEEEDDDDEGQEDEQEKDNDHDIERSFAFVDRAREKLLDKLRRFELLAELDPVELEKRLAEEDEDFEEEEKDDDDDDDGCDAGNACFEHNEKKSGNVFVKEVMMSGSNYYRHERAPFDTKRLVRDLMVEEGENTETSDKVSNRLNSWKKVELDTIEMMLEFDFKREGNVWKEFHEGAEETGVEIEIAIFSFLVEELSVELSHP